MKRQINNRERFKQSILFEGLENNKCSFTDIDFIQEIDNHTLIVGDCKVKDNPLTMGQKILIERLCNKKWKHSFGVVVEHNVPTTEDIILKDTFVREVYVDNVWIDYRNKNLTFEAFMDALKIGTSIATGYRAIVGN